MISRWPVMLMLCILLKCRGPENVRGRDSKRGDSLFGTHGLIRARRLAYANPASKMGWGGITSCLNTNYDLIFDVMIFSGAEGEQDCLSPTTQLTESPQNLLCILFCVFINSRFWVQLRVRYILTVSTYLLNCLPDGGETPWSRDGSFKNFRVGNWKVAGGRGLCLQ